MSETISPQQHMTGGTGTVDAPLNAYDKNYNSTCNLAASAAFQYAELQTYDFEADSDPANRTSVTIRLRMAGILLNDPDDSIWVLFKPSAPEPWTNLDYMNMASAPVKATWKEYDVTALVGTTPASEWQFACQFVKATAFDPPNPGNP